MLHESNDPNQEAGPDHPHLEPLKNEPQEFGNELPHAPELDALKVPPLPSPEETTTHSKPQVTQQEPEQKTNRIKNLVSLIWSLEAKREWLSKKVEKDIGWWQEHSYLTSEQATTLKSRFDPNKIQPYLLDFVSHVSLSACGTAVSLPLAAYLIASGHCSLFGGYLLDSTVGCAIKTGYTLHRIHEAKERGERKPYIALGYGIVASYVPFYGAANLGFLVEQAFSSKEDKQFAKFMIATPMVKASSRFHLTPLANRVARWVVGEKE